MKQVWKFHIMTDGWVEIPRDAQPLSVQMQGGLPVMWALVDPRNPLEKRRLCVAGTGHDLPDDPGPFIGTFQMDGFVFHVFGFAPESGS